MNNPKCPKCGSSLKLTRLAQNWLCRNRECTMMYVMDNEVKWVNKQ